MRGRPCCRSFDLCRVASAAAFVRVDSNRDGSLDVSDAIFTLKHLFVVDEAARCEDASDSNDDGTLNIADAVFGLSCLFRGAECPPFPFPLCGVDPTEGDLDCELVFCP